MGNISLVKVGGVCAILVVVSGIMARIVFGNAWLASRGVDTLITGHWFDVLALLLSMPAALGFYRALDEASAVLRIAVTAFVTGTIFLLFHEFVRLGIGYELVVPDTLVQIGWLAAGVGYILIYGIGVLLFSFAILRTSVIPKWIGWLGLINVAVHAVLLTVLSGVFESVSPPWWLAVGASMGWVLAMGVVLLRLKEPVAADSVGVSSSPT